MKKQKYRCNKYNITVDTELRLIDSNTMLHRMYVNILLDCNPFIFIKEQYYH